jgi:protein-disulfide isomerase
MSRWSVLGFLLLIGCWSSSSSFVPETPANRSAAPVVTEGVQYVGNPNARVVLTYYFDYQCPHCYAFSPELDAIARTYGDRIVVHYKNFQMAMHPGARLAGISAEAARRQGRFIEMHRALMKHASSEPSFSPEVLRTIAQSVGLDLARYDADIADPAAAARVDGEYAEGEQRGNEFVPVIYFGAARFEDRLDTATVSAEIDKHLAR